MVFRTGADNREKGARVAPFFVPGSNDDMQKRISGRQNQLSVQCSDAAIQSLSRWTRGPGPTGPEAERRSAMTNLLNRILDLSVSFAVLGLTLTIAGATAGLGA